MIPIKIEANDPSTLKIIWQLTTACTYACEYCPKELHTGQSIEIDLIEFRKFLNMFSDRNIVLTITGGEPTIHPQFLEIAKLLKELNVKTVVDSNLSRTTRFYKEVAGLIDNWCVTLHPSQHSLDIEKIKVLAESSFTVVYVMMDPLYWNIAHRWWNDLKFVENIKLSVLKPVDNWAGATYRGVFTKEQQDFLNTTLSLYTFSDERIAEMKPKYKWLSDLGSTVHYNNGSKDMLDADALMKQGLNKFKGWSCNAGDEVIVLSNTGNVSLATCGVANLGHWSSVNINDIKEPVICPRDYCHCGTDIKASKHQHDLL
jgi:organic radical activating enzyme